ncbi:sensor histidine kinase [Otoolea muris]|uniref:sensor histidine kinase n=1 Tax=Otoolea muris TaxID=2941515 RepID=UPI00203E2D41|nr:HAMP domain-containing sensor histidine kinase [Otoolea muris]
MSGRKNILVTFGFVLSTSLAAAAVSVLLASYHYSRLQFELLNVICGEVVEEEPETKIIISAALKEYTGGNPDGVAEEDVLSALGYRISDFSGATSRQNILFVAAGFLTGILLFIVTFLYRNKREAIRIRNLAEYLEQVNTGRAAILSASGEDDFSKLEDEIYKTVTFLYQTKDKAIQAKNDFAENLSNIAHQLKTPITAISLSVQMMKQNMDHKHLEQIEKQLLRLTHLEDALLLLSRIDAGTLRLQRDEVDVFTLLVLAADNLQELFVSSRAAVDIPEQGEMLVTADLDWTMEAVMNLMKNCMEHSPGGTVHCSYAQNPLYTEILIWDDGEGFAKEDIPHLFERFYRGENACEGGIGIGLALSKEMIERQNGTIRAKNKPEGGALFEIRFYSH